MAPSRLLPPVLGAGSVARRLLLGYARAHPPPPPPKLALPAPFPSVASAFLAPGSVSRHVRCFSSSSSSDDDPRPPKPPPPPPSDGPRPTFDDFSHLDPNNAQNREPPARASSCSSSSSSSSSTEPASAPGASESREPSASESRPEEDGSSAASPAPAPGAPAPDASRPVSPPPRASAVPAAPNFAAFMDRLQASLFRASQRVNDLTGYSDIETLKQRVTGLEDALLAAQERLHAARSSYKARVAERAATQREVTTLLARQKTWTPLDFERFTSLYRDDYDLEAAVAEGARELEEAEREAERINRDLSASILARYHEEQIWSDKIRRMSTWGTWGLMGVNVLLFLVFQFGAEPWRRARLVKGFEEKVSEALEKQRVAKDLEVGEAWAGGAAAAAAAATATAVPPAATAPAAGSEVSDPVPVVAEATIPAPTPDGTTFEPTVITEPAPSMAEERAPVSWLDALSSPALLKQAALDLVSDRKVVLTMRHLSLVALQSAAAGVAVTATFAVFLFRRT